MKEKSIPRVNWLDPLKAFALIGVMLNHLVEELKPGTWFSEPSGIWARYLEKLPIFVSQEPFSVSAVKILAWLGDYGPGVFIITSGFGLLWAALHSNQISFDWKGFLHRRILRLFPLYIFLHLLYLVAKFAMGEGTTTFTDYKFFLSMLGLRATDDLFFYINPSWWFIWLILQLYIIFPLLYSLLKRLGIGKFLLLTCLFTLASRLAGLLEFRYSESLYYWMLGIFFGTRLAEFCIGMVLAALMHEGTYKKIQRILELKYIFPLSILVLSLGLVSSFVRYGSLVDYFLVTLGLSGLFYSFWKIIFEKRKRLSGFVTMLGVEAYGIYLVHQLILQKAVGVFPEDWRLIGSIVVVIASFPTGIYLNKLAYWFIQKAKELGRQERTLWLRISSWILGLGTLVSAGILEVSTPDSLVYRIMAMIAIGGLILLLAWEVVRSHVIGGVECLLHRLGICFSILTLFVAPQASLKLRLLLGVLVAVLSSPIYFRWKKKLQSWIFGLAVTIALFAGLETLLLYTKPIETGYWGELPALQTHPTRTYALKPNQRIHLKYNNYDYYVSTNSIGLNSPEIGLDKPSEDTIRILVVGDAFSMPEGMEFESGYAAILETQISQIISPRQVQVINAGVTGYGPVEEYPQLKELLPLLKPNIVIYQFFIDDFGQVDGDPQDKLARIGLTGDKGFSLNSFLLRSQVGGHLDKFIDYRLEFLFNPIREIFGRSLRWRYEKALLEYYETGENRFYSQGNLALIQSHVARMNALCLEFDATLIIYFVPGAIEVSAPADISYFPWDQDVFDKSIFDLDLPYANLLKVTDMLQVPTVNLRDPLKGNPNQPVYFPDSWHWNQEGHRTVASFIALDLERRGQLSGFTVP